MPHPLRTPTQIPSPCPYPQLRSSKQLPTPATPAPLSCVPHKPSALFLGEIPSKPPPPHLEQCALPACLPAGLLRPSPSCAPPLICSRLRPRPTTTRTAGVWAQGCCAAAACCTVRRVRRPMQSVWLSHASLCGAQPSSLPSGRGLGLLLPHSRPWSYPLLLSAHATEVATQTRPPLCAQD